MVGLVVLAVLLAAATAALIVRALALPRMRVTAHLRQIDHYGMDSVVASGDALYVRPPLGPIVNGLAEGIGRSAIASVRSLKPLPQAELTSAGFYTLSLEAFHGYRVLATLAVPALLGLWVLSLGQGMAMAVAVTLLAAAVVWVLFGGFVRRRSEARLNAVDAELPELIDVLIATIEAGLGFAASLQLVSSRFEGPLGNELRLAQQEQSMGLTTSQALDNILQRSDTPAMRSFVRAVVQGETLGVSIGAMMRNLAIEMRTRRRQAAQERVQKAPLKMLFPLVFLIFPAMFIVLLYPAVHELLRGFSSIR